jgi:hypothetical protein
MTSMLRALMQGDFSQWLPLFNRFDEFFEKLTTPRQDVGLKFDGSASPDPPFPLNSCLEVLRVTAILLENCSSKQSYASYEVGARKPQRVQPCCAPDGCLKHTSNLHSCFVPLPLQHLRALLAAPHQEVVLAALRALVAFLKKTHYANIRWQGHRELNGRLSVLTQPWGGKEEVGQWGSGMGAGASELAAVMQVTSPQRMSCQRARQTDHSQYAEGLTLHEKQNEESYNVPLWEQDLGFRLIASNGMMHTCVPLVGPYRVWTCCPACLWMSATFSRWGARECQQMKRGAGKNSFD